ncbi:type IV pillus assembly protein [Trinickia terrae]|uniref:Type IV pillus assembly protein n=2 Tax=Trinickia terrae TaxID=2571161 RepID=A0A4U1ICA3_9BURK|nr:type IV pillus assembly protein [Trinickia terrae]
MKHIQQLKQSRRGHTLLELLIAMMLGLVVIGGAVSLYRSQRQAFAQAADEASMSDAGMTALTLIGQQVHMAGFVSADTPPRGASEQTGAWAATPSLFGCSGARPVGAGGVPNCEPLASGSDGIAVRYVGDAVSTWPTASGQATDCLGQGVGASGAAELIVNRYYARLSASTGEPELYCEGNGRSGVGQPLVEGIERLRIRYWLRGATTSVDANRVAADQWSRVVAVDLCVLTRGAPTRPRVRYVDCDGATVLAADRRARRAFARRIALRNNEAVPL